MSTQGTRSSLRRHILAFVGGLILLSLLGSTISLYRITEVNSVLDAINRVSVPLGRLFGQMQSDADILNRELEHGLGYSHWSDPHWRPRPIPDWIRDVLRSEVSRAQELMRSDGEWTEPDSKARWSQWAQMMSEQYSDLMGDAQKLYDALNKHDQDAALKLYPRWNASMQDWRRQLQWGASQYEHQMRETFALAQSRVAELRMGLELILGVVVLLSLLMLWLGERALRPLAELTQLARAITRRGLRREDKAHFPEIPLGRNDEVSQLAREFHRMATALLEREKTVETQNNRLQEQNHLLREMGALNENVLNSIDSILLVTDLHGRITQCNPIAVSWLGQSDGKQLVGTLIGAWAKLRPLVLKRPSNLFESVKISPIAIEGRVYGGHWMPLRQESATSGTATGSILVLDDLTEEINLQERLRQAENLAAVGRMSAQVAHEVRNPLHSIGLEAEMASELAASLPPAASGLSAAQALRQSLQSILRGVDRLENITENYLKLSKLSTGDRASVDLGEVLESMLATYASACEAQGVRVDWKREKDSDLRVWGDRDLLEQVFGNLMSNALQALEGSDGGLVVWSLGSAESGRVWARIEDSGPGVPEEIRGRLFTPFVTSKAQGTGLGLSFVKKVIEDQGGNIEFQGGSRFEILLPSQPRNEKLGTEGVAAHV